MYISGFEWDEWNIEHIGNHGVTPQEVEEACYNQPICRRIRGSLYLVYGQTDAGRYLFIVTRYRANGMAYVVTARGMTKTERRYYHKRR